ncbi:J domain-containing protein [Thermodesulfobacteriota bacterium]
MTDTKKKETYFLTVRKTGKTKECLACGTDRMKSGRRYCSKACRQKVIWVLSLSKGLLRVSNARYAAFSFTDGHVMLDILPVWSKEISRFVYRRTRGKKPADDLKTLILQAGTEWYRIIQDNNSQSYATLCLMKDNHHKGLSPESIKPNQKVRPRLSKDERQSLKFMNLKLDEVLCDRSAHKIKTAYKKLAKIYHPDVGGDEEKFKKLSAANQQMLMWAENPQFTFRRALIDSWSYDRFTDRWSPPL